MVGKHYLCREIVAACAVFRKEREEVKFDCAVPVKELGVGMVFLEFLELDGVTADYLALEIVILVGIFRIHQRSGGIRFYCITEYTPVGIITIYDSWGHIEIYSEQSAFCCMHY